MKNSCAVGNCRNPIQAVPSPIVKRLKVELCEVHTECLEEAVQEALLEAEALGLEITAELIEQYELRNILFPGDTPRLQLRGGGHGNQSAS